MMLLPVIARTRCPHLYVNYCFHIIHNTSFFTVRLSGKRYLHVYDYLRVYI